MSDVRRSRIYTLLLLLVLLLAGGCQRGGWVEVKPGPPAPKMKWRFLHTPLRGIWTPDGKHLWAVGIPGTILHSSDGGWHWNYQEITGRQFVSIHGTADGQNIWAVGSKGVFAKSVDKGRSWSLKELPGRPPLLKIHGSMDGRTLRAFDRYGLEYQSNDGGEKWHQSPSKLLHALFSINDPESRSEIKLQDIAITENGKKIFAVGADGLFAFSIDGGRSWRLEQWAKHSYLLRVGASKDGSKIVVYGFLEMPGQPNLWTGIATDSSNTSWAFKSSDLLSEDMLSAIFIDRQDGVWKGARIGKIATRPSISQSWESRGPALGYPWEFASIGKGTLWAVGSEGLGAVLTRSTDNGATWESQKLELQPVAIANSPDGLWVYGHNGMIADCTPKCILRKLPGEIEYALGGIGQAGEQVWIVEGSKLFTSEDRGSTWRSVEIKGAQSLRDRFRSRTEDWLVDRSGQVFNSSRDGSWNLHSRVPFTSVTTSATELLGFEQDSGVVLFVVDSGGGIWRESSRKEWVKIYDSEQFFISLAGTPDGRHLWFTGGLLNTLAYSADLGRNWQRAAYSGPVRFKSTSVSPDGSSVFAVGDGIVLLGHSSGTYPRVLQARLKSQPSGGARLELRIEGSPDEIILRCGSKRYPDLGQISKVESTLIRPNTGSNVWSIEFSPGSQEVGLEPGEDLYAEVTLGTKGPSKGEEISSDAQVFRQAFRLPPLAYRPWWKEPTALPVAVYISWLIFLTTLLVVWPVGLLKVQRFLAAFNLSRLLEPIPVLGPLAKLTLDTAGALPLFARAPRALDAWIGSHRDAIRKRFEAEEAVLRSSGYVSLPVRIGRSLIDRPDARAFSHFSNRQRTLIQIVGIGGAGKTMLAVQVARWAIAGKDEGGIDGKPILPVLIDEDTQDLRAVVKRKLTSWFQEEISDELLNALLRKQRILVIVDRVSERASETRDHLRTVHGSQPINALMVTTRQPLDFEAGGGVLVCPQPLGSETLLHFMTSLLQDPSRSGVFQEMEDQLELGKKLAKLIRRGAEKVPLTPLLARLYVDKAIELVRKGTTLDNLPPSIPEVYFEFLRSVNPPGGMTDSDMLRACEVLAELALMKGFVPHEILRSEAHEALAAAEWKEPGQPDSILRRLRDNGVLQETNVGTEVLLRFTLDPVAEFLAASAHAKRCGESISAWKTLVLKIDQAGPQASGFRLALRLVCEAYGQRLDWACSEAISRLTQESPLP